MVHIGRRGRAQVLGLCLARADAAHPLHRYAAALPMLDPTPLGWPHEGRASLEGSALAPQLAAAESALRASTDALVAALLLRTARMHDACSAAWALDEDDMIQALGLERRLWARSMYTSRAFRLSGTATAGGELGAWTGGDAAAEQGRGAFWLPGAPLRGFASACSLRMLRAIALHS